MAINCHCPDSDIGLHNSSCDYTLESIPIPLRRRPEAVVEAAYSLLSSLEAWGRTDEHHRAETPRRFVEALQELTERQPFNFTTFPSTSDEMIVSQDIGYVALCAHHVLPFFGKAHVAYIPSEKIAGLSKLARTVKTLAKGFHVQEELTAEIAVFLEEQLEPRGLAVVLQGRHLCMEIRGVQAEGVITTTSAMRGVFLDEKKGARGEFLSLIQRH